MERRKTLWIPAVAAVAWTGLTLVPAWSADEPRKDERKSRPEAPRERAKRAPDAQPQPDRASTSPGTSASDAHGYGSGNTVGTDQQGRVDPSRTQGKPQANGNADRP